MYKLKSILKSIFLLSSFLLISNTTLAYSDIPEDHPNLTAINYITEAEIAGGYPDGTFKPDQALTRAEFTKIIIKSATGIDPIEYKDDCFQDVKSDDWYSSFLCYAKKNEIVNGFPDQSFKPNKTISVVEAAKIVAEVYGLEKEETETTHWFENHVKGLAEKNYLPASFKYYEQKVTRSEIAEMIWRIKTEVIDKNSINFEDLSSMPCYEIDQNMPANVDMDRVRETWLSWYNQERTAYGLEPYKINNQLSRTSIIWSEEAKRRGYIDHKRAGQTAYYDYNMITNWFANHGLTFENWNRATHTENIAWEMYSCSEEQEDCTDEMIAAIRKAYNFFYSEKGRSYRPHYNSIVKPEFREMGLGIAVDRSKNKYYLTAHFGTKISSNPEPICGEF